MIMARVEISVIRIADNSFYPGILELELTDSKTKRHRIFEKAPCVYADFEIDPFEEYGFPVKAFIDCKILFETESTYIIELYRDSVDGIDQFEVDKERVSI